MTPQKMSYRLGWSYDGDQWLTTRADDYRYIQEMNALVQRTGALIIHFTRQHYSWSYTQGHFVVCEKRAKWTRGQGWMIEPDDTRGATAHEMGIDDRPQPRPKRHARVATAPARTTA